MLYPLAQLWSLALFQGGDLDVAGPVGGSEWRRGSKSAPPRKTTFTECVDTNLANFCLADNRVVLVDVLPPLIPSARPEPSNLFEVLFNALCFDTMVILDALIGYAARALLRASASLAASQREDLARQVPQECAGAFPASWFRARVVLALRALAGEAEPARVHDFFDLTSVRAFRDLPEAERVHRVRQVDQTVKELALL